MPRKRKSFLLKDEIYYSNFLVMAGGDYKQACAQMKRTYERELKNKWPKNFEYSEEEIEWDACFMKSPVKSFSGLWFSDLKPKGHVVTHECYHAMWHVMNTVGIDLNKEASEEAAAYYLSWLVRQIGRRFW